MPNLAEAREKAQTSRKLAPHGGDPLGGVELGLKLTEPEEMNRDETG